MKKNKDKEKSEILNWFPNTFVYGARKGWEDKPFTKLYEAMKKIFKK